MIKSMFLSSLFSHQLALNFQQQFGKVKIYGHKTKQRNKYLFKYINHLKKKQGILCLMFRRGKDITPISSCNSIPFFFVVGVRSPLLLLSCGV